MNGRVVGRIAGLVLCCAASVALAFWLAGCWRKIPIGDRRYKGFITDNAGANGRPLRWTRDYSKIDIPGIPWRPLRIELSLRSAPQAGPPPTVAVSINDAPIRSIVVDREILNETIDYDGPRDPVLSLQFRSPHGRERLVAVADARVVPVPRGAMPWWTAVSGLLAGYLVWTSAVGIARKRLSLAVASSLIVLWLGAGAAAFGAGSLLTGLWGFASTWAAESLRVAALLLLLIVPGWCAIDVMRDRANLRALPDATALLSVPATIVFLGVVLLILQPLRAGPTAFAIALLALYGGAAALILLNRERRARAAQDVLDYRWFLLAPALVSVCAICYLGVGHETFSELTGWTQAAYRNLHVLPQDNELSWLASETWRRHLRANALFFGLWRIGDRGPLYAVVHSVLFRALQPDAPTFAAYTRLGIVLNSLFLAPLFLWLSKVLDRRAAWAVTILVGLNPWIFLNIYYTWPKLFSACFLVSAAYLLWRRPAPQSTAAFAAAGLLGGLSALAHAGSLLTMPVFYGVTLAGFVRSGRVLGRSLAFPAVLLLVLAPWQMYKNRYSPETYNLFYMHYLDERDYFTPLAHNVGRFLAEHPASEQVAVRTKNLRELWWQTIDPSLIAGFWRGEDVGQALYELEFYSPWYSAGLLWGVWLVVAAPLHRFRRGAASDARRPDVSVAAVALFVAVSLTANEALRWRPPHSHELPYTELVMLAALILVAMARCGMLWLAVAAAAVVARQVFYFTRSVEVSGLPLPAMDRFGVLFWLTVALLAWLATRTARYTDLQRDARSPVASVRSMSATSNPRLP